MAEISREEAMHQIGEWYGGFAEKPSEDAIHKAISDMEKIEKIEQYLEDSCASDCVKCEHTDICDSYGIIQILRGEKND